MNTLKAIQERRSIKHFDPSQLGYGMESLTNLDISSNQIESISSFVKRGSTKGLKTLTISRNLISDLSESNLQKRMCDMNKRFLSYL